MSMGFKPCPHCKGNGEAEALLAVDGQIEWFCSNCHRSWTETPTDLTTIYQDVYTKEEVT